MTPLANIVLKTDKIGCAVPKKHVTPAEATFLIADNRVNSGGDPIVRFEPVPDDAQEVPIKNLSKQIAAIDKMLDETSTLKLADGTELPDMIKEKRDAGLTAKRNRLANELDTLQRTQMLRNLAPEEEVMRLCMLYGDHRIKRLFPGEIPALPQTFEQARKIGLRSSVAAQRFQHHDGQNSWAPRE